MQKNLSYIKKLQLMRIAFTLTVLPQVIRNFEIYFGFATARNYGYFGRKGLSWQRRFSSQTQMVKILLYGNDMCSLYVSLQEGN